MNVVEVLPKDAIPSIDDPSFSRDHVGDPDDRVIAIEGSPARAYPLRILHYHEIVNDTLDDRPIVVTWCPLCGSAVVFDRIVDGDTLTFGVSGKLADDDLVMYDRETGSEWKQSLGECIAGPLEGTRLPPQPASLISWATFRDTYPDGIVLQPPHLPSEAASDDDQPARVNYDITPYERYFERDGFGLGAHRHEGSGRIWDRDDLDPKTVILGLVTETDALGFPLPTVREEGGVVQTTVGGRAVVIFEHEDELHAFVNPGIAFQPTDDGFASDGTRWDPTTGRSADGRELERLPAIRVFAFAWQDDHGPDAFYGRAER